MNNFVAKNNFNKGGYHEDKHKQIPRDNKYKDTDIEDELLSIKEKEEQVK